MRWADGKNLMECFLINFARLSVKKPAHAGAQQ